jgi:hypothetical protein
MSDFALTTACVLEIFCKNTLARLAKDQNIDQRERERWKEFI